MLIARVLGLAALGATLFGGATAFAASAQTTSRGTVNYFEVSTLGSGTATAVVTGAITDYGVDHVGVADNGNVNQIVLQKGSFEVNVSKLNKADTPRAPCEDLLVHRRRDRISDASRRHRCIRRDQGDDQDHVHECRHSAKTDERHMQRERLGGAPRSGPLGTRLRNRLILVGKPQINYPMQSETFEIA